jgi:RNA-directed DNA polymerase
VVVTTSQHAPAITGAQSPEDLWTSIDWAKASKQVRNLRQRIFRATQEQDWQKVRDLQRLLLRSYSNLALSIRQITQVNDGRKTPGVDGETALISAERGKLLCALRQAPPPPARPTRRVYIPKASGKQRPLGTPTVRDRVRQHVVKTALEPSWEARFEPTSYGFRPGRSVHDAIQHLRLFLRSQPRSRFRHEWVLDADIRAAFDRISHDYVLARIGGFPARNEVRSWLKAGYLELGTLHATNEGTPQGGVITPPAMLQTSCSSWR